MTIIDTRRATPEILSNAIKQVLAGKENISEGRKSVIS